MRTEQRFTAVIQGGDGGGAFVDVPFDVERVFGKKRAPIVATIDGEPYRGTLVRMGGDGHILLVLKVIREKIGKTIGDLVDVTIEEDAAPRVVVVPADLSAALDGDEKAASFFRALSYTHQREYVTWIEEAKRDETRRKRIERTVAMLRESRKTR
jgi:hypothetical protein